VGSEGGKRLDHMSPELWQLWKTRFGQVSSLNTVKSETRTRVFETKKLMEKINGLV
jgi:hypothetical protein